MKIRIWICLVILVFNLTLATSGFSQENSLHPNNIRSLAWSPNGKLIALGIANGTIVLKDVSGQTITTFQTNNGIPADPSVWLSSGVPDSLVWSPDSRYLAIGEKKIVEVWD